MKDSINVENVWTNCLFETGFETLSIEQMYAVRNKMTKYIDELRDKRAAERYEKAQREREEHLKNFVPNPQYY